MKAKPMKPQAQPKAEPTTTAAPAQPIAAQPQATTGTSLAVVEYGEEAGAGLENITADERTIPFITILQSNSLIWPSQVEPRAFTDNLLNNLRTLYAQ